VKEASKRYFDLFDDVYIDGRWHLVGPTDENGVDLSGLFHRGEPSRVKAPVLLKHSDAAERGSPLDYSRVSGTTIPIVRPHVAELLKRLAGGDVELVPAIVDGSPEQLYVVNVITTRRCIDNGATGEVLKFTEADRDVWPDRVGEYMYVSGLKIDKTQVKDAKVFRTWGWNALIVAEEIKDALEAAHVTGVKFTEV